MMASNQTQKMVWKSSSLHERYLTRRASWCPPRCFSNSAALSLAIICEFPFSLFPFGSYSYHLYFRYDHLTEVLNKILVERPENIVDFFEDYSRKVKESRFKAMTDHLEDIYVEPGRYALANKIMPLLKVPTITYYKYISHIFFPALSTSSPQKQVILVRRIQKIKP